jgi:preprotein translocase subunit YajC
MNLLTHLATSILTQAEAAPAGGDGGPMSGLVGMLPLLLMFLVIYFLLIRPAGKQRKQHAELKKDDEVVTAAGFFGRIIAIDEKIVTLEIADKVKIKILRDRIAGRWSEEAQPQTKK